LHHIKARRTTSKILKYVKVKGAINQLFRSTEHTILKIHTTLSRPVTAYGTEALVIRRAHASR
jgi:hypothetical protein